MLNADSLNADSLLVNNFYFWTEIFQLLLFDDDDDGEISMTCLRSLHLGSTKSNLTFFKLLPAGGHPSNLTSVTTCKRWHSEGNEKFIAPPSSQTVKEADLGRVLSINHQFLKLQIYNPTKTLKRPISTTKIKH